MTALADFVPRALTTTAFRLAATSVAAFVIATAAIVFTLFWQTNALLTEHVVSGLRDETAELVAESRSGDLAALAAKVQAKSRPDGRALYILLGPAGEKLAGNLNRVPPELLDSPQGGVFRYDAGSDAQGRSERLAVAIQVDLEGGAKLVVGRDIEDQRGYAARVKTIFFAGFGLLALTGLLAGLGVSRSVLKRIEDITQTSRSIMAGDLARRVPVRDTGGGELDDLAASLNAMLERIEQLMNGLREVSDNIAHDLKTPLNRLRNRAEAALRDARGAEAYKEGLEQTIEEADELIKTFNALLLIARLEAGAIEESAERFDIGALVADVAELYQPVAEEEGLEIDIDAESGLIIEANRQLVSPGRRQPGRQRDQVRDARQGRWNARDQRAGRQARRFCRAFGGRSRARNSGLRPRACAQALREARGEPNEARHWAGLEPRCGGCAPPSRYGTARGQRTGALRHRRSAARLSGSERGGGASGMKDARSCRPGRGQASRSLRVSTMRRVSRRA